MPEYQLIQLTFSFSDSDISFLDLKVFKNPMGQIATDLYRKPTAGNTLHASCSHPCPLICSIPYAQYLRLQRNCTEDGDFLAQAAALRTLVRGYTRTNLRKAFNKAFAQTRTSLLYGPPHTNLPQTVKIITKFSIHHNQLRTSLSEHWHLLTDHHVLSKYVRSKPKLVFCRASSWRDRLTSSHYQVGPGETMGPRGTFRHCPRCP